MDLRKIIEEAYLEDIPNGDISTDPLQLPERQVASKLIAKQDLKLSGLTVFARCFLMHDPEAKLKWYFKDSDIVLKGQTVGTIQADAAKTLKAERVALNFLGRLSGIATLTYKFVKQTDGTRTKILDTRKTTPLLRELEKLAVVHGGGVNHRKNLSHMVMLKDNHIDLAGGIRPAVEACRKENHSFIEVECKTLEQVQECVEIGISRIMLDNMDNETTRQALEKIPPSIETEASGNMNLDRVREVSDLGVDFISVGAITHSAPIADFSLLTDYGGGSGNA